MKPEQKIRAAIIARLKREGWFVKITHGGKFQSGFPDLYAVHLHYGARWIEVKNSAGYKFTAAQLKIFPDLVRHGAGVWILTSDSDEEYTKLFYPSNWTDYLKKGRAA